MWKSYLSKDYFLYLFLALILTLWMDWWGVSFWLLAFSALYFFIHRRIDRLKSDGNRQFDDLIKSPINGQVISIREGINHIIFGKDLIEVGLMMPHFFEAGLYLPISAEIEYCKEFPAKEYFRYQRKLKIDQQDEVYGGTLLMLGGKKEQFLGLQMVKCFLGLSAKIWALPGDRGKTSARFGYFPFGGSVFCYFSKNYEVVAKVGDKIQAGETVVAKERVGLSS